MGLTAEASSSGTDPEHGFNLEWAGPDKSDSIACYFRDTFPPYEAVDCPRPGQRAIISASASLEDAAY